MSTFIFLFICDTCDNPYLVILLEFLEKFWNFHLKEWNIVLLLVNAVICALYKDEEG